MRTYLDHPEESVMTLAVVENVEVPALLAGRSPRKARTGGGSSRPGPPDKSAGNVSPL
jgi:hypothetical protein